MLQVWPVIMSTSLTICYMNYFLIEFYRFETKYLKKRILKSTLKPALVLVLHLGSALSIYKFSPFV